MRHNRLVHVAERISELRSCPAGRNDDARAAVTLPHQPRSEICTLLTAGF
jgi:hypothetical protein